MSAQQIKDLKDDLDVALNQAISISEENAFLKRVLKQAMLTYGGELKVDISLASEAMEDNRRIEFGGGGIRFL